MIDPKACKRPRVAGRKLISALAGLATFALFSLGAMPEASSLTLKEFDRLSSVQKENFVTTVLHFNYYTYKKNPETASKARCMVDLDRREFGSGETYLSALVTERIDLRRADDAKHAPTVEKLIKELIEQECQTY